MITACDSHDDGAALLHDIVDEGVGDAASAARVGVERTDDAQQVDERFVAGDVVLPAPDVARDLLDGVGVEDVA